MQTTTPRNPRAGRRASTRDRTALTVPSRALTGRPSPSTIDFGSAKNERYNSQGTSAISRRGGIAPGYGSGALEPGTPRSTLEHPAVFGPAEVAPAGHQRRRQFDRGVVAVHDHG